MFQFMLILGLVLAFYGYSVMKNPRAWGNQGRDAVKPENWNGYVVRNGRVCMYAGFLMAALGALDAAFSMPTWVFLLILLGGLAMILCPLCSWMHRMEGSWWPWPKQETEAQKRKRIAREQEKAERQAGGKNKK